MSLYQTPGVYVRERDVFPKSIVEGATAIPVFIGYTEKHPETKWSRIASIKEYEDAFGGPHREQVRVVEAENGFKIYSESSERSSDYVSEYLMFYSVNMYFANGGGDCYIVSAGNYAESGDKVQKADLLAGLELLEEQALTEPTLVVIPEAIKLGDDYTDVYNQALTASKESDNMFALMDVKQKSSADNDAADFRNGITSDELNLRQGAAYYPYLRSNTVELFEEKSVMVGESEKAVGLNELIDSRPRFIYSDVDAKMVIRYRGFMESSVSLVSDAAATEVSFVLHEDRVKNTVSLEITYVTAADWTTVLSAWDTFNQSEDLSKGFELSGETVALGDSTVIAFSTFKVEDDFLYQSPEHPLMVKRLSATGKEVTSSVASATLEFVENPEDTVDNKQFDLAATGQTDSAIVINFYGTQSYTDFMAWYHDVKGTGAGEIDHDVWSLDYNDGFAGTLSTQNLKAGILMLARDVTFDSARYNAVKAFLNTQRVVLPPCAAVAGVYARTDRDRGIWKAPAGSSLLNVSGAAVQISDSKQQNLNVHTTGKSINAIRSFAGKGVLVWGARTLDGNSNDWRYVNVRRLFLSVEKAAKEALSGLVFEPNEPNTWVIAKAMVDSYLSGLWKRGALVGSVKEDAFTVNIGLGITMDQNDVNNGQMNMEIAMAPSRPGEFIVLTFSQLMQSV